MGVRLTEESMAENLRNGRLELEKVFFLTLLMFFFDWLVLVADIKIGGFIWFFSAAFHVYGTKIWLDIVIASIRCKKLLKGIEKYLFIVDTCFVSCLAIYTFYYLAQLELLNFTLFIIYISSEIKYVYF